MIAIILTGTTHDARAADGEPAAVRLRDCLSVWGNPKMTTAGKHTPATFAQARPAERAKLLGVANVMMAGLGLPNDDAKAESLTKQVAHCPRILWEITADGKGGPPFVYENRVAQVLRLIEQYPQIEGVVLDDMSSVGWVDRVGSQTQDRKPPTT